MMNIVVVNIRLACRRSFICNAGRDAAFHFPNSYYKECSFNRLIVGSMGVLYQWLLLSYKSVCSQLFQHDAPTLVNYLPSERNRHFFFSFVVTGWYCWFSILCLDLTEKNSKLNTQSPSNDTVAFRDSHLNYI